MTRILVIDGHPDPVRQRFVHVLADAYAEAAAAHHEVKRIELSTLDFPLIRSAADWQEGAPPPAIAEAQSAIVWAQHLVFFYPLWLGDMPALLKAFLEQVARPDFAFRPRAGGLPEKLLKGRSARVVVTMGMPRLFYTLVYRSHSLRSLERNILAFTGISPIRHSIVGSVGGRAAHRTKKIAQMRRLGRRGH